LREPAAGYGFLVINPRLGLQSSAAVAPFNGPPADITAVWFIVLETFQAFHDCAVLCYPPGRRRGSLDRNPM
jgi:hypothetical protein